MRAHCRKLASLVEHHESRANTAEKTLTLVNQQRKKAARQSEEFVEYIRVPRRGKVTEQCVTAQQTTAPRDLCTGHAPFRSASQCCASMSSNAKEFRSAEYYIAYLFAEKKFNGTVKISRLRRGTMAQ